MCGLWYGRVDSALGFFYFDIDMALLVGDTGRL